ncbi:MAG: DUF1294 domain-containing protein [Oscillospiraceae bacterium]|nr:DUF1294 domain-containing protein [Oscillospiraceae bacterium]
MKYFVIYLLVINTIAFGVFGWDKLMAKWQKRRVPEKTLFLLAALLGSVGAWLGMQLFRHKTKHTSFVVGIPAILVAQMAAAAAVWYFLVR